MVTIIQNFIELLYLYKTSYLFNIHIFLMVVVFSLLVLAIYKEKTIMKREQNPKLSNCHNRMGYVDYIRSVKDNTSKEIQKLQRSQEFQRYMKGRYDPKSKYYEGNKNYDDIEKIVFSDEDEEEDRKNI